MDSIFHRVSIRKYEAKEVEQEKIERMLKAAMAAPSACNQQPWEFYVVTDKKVIAQLSEASPYAHPAEAAGAETRIFSQRQFNSKKILP